VNQSYILLFATFLSSILLIGLPPVHAQDDDPMRVRITTKKKDGNVVELYAVNPAPFPQTVKLDFTELNNFRADIPLPIERVVKANMPRTKWLTLTPYTTKRSSAFNYHADYHRGDIHNTRHDNSVTYRLPYAHGSTHEVGQGYGGVRTHSRPGRTKAIDFTMPVGTRIHAARSGVVIDIKEDSSSGGNDIAFIKSANYVNICHNDGTFATYSHLQKNGASVRVGKRVNAGDPIGFSGNTGWSSAPHLHFEVFFPRDDGKVDSIATRFLLESGPVDRLVERQKYTAHHR